MSYSIGFDIFAKDRAGPVISHLGDTTEKTEKKMSGFKTAAIAGMAVAGAAVVGFGLSAVNKFKEVGTETNALIRTMGGTAESASRLRFAATQSGVSFESFAKSTTKLAKFLAASGPVMKTVSVRVKENQNGITLLSATYAKNSAGLVVHTEHLRQVANGMQTMITRVKTGDGTWKTTGEVVTKASDKYVTLKKSIEVTNPVIAKLGIQVRDSKGHLKSMADILPLLADKFKSMPGGPEKTALAMQLFGKAGTEMLPFLNKGSEGIKELEKESDKYGLTLNSKMLASLKASKAGQREWNASLDGLKVQIGAQVLPIMTQMVTLIRSRVIPVVVAVTGFLQKHAGTAKFVAMIIGTLVVGIKAWTIAQKILNTVLAMNPIGMIVVALAALAVGFVYAYQHCKTFRDIVNGAFRVVATAIDWCKDHWKLLITLILGPFGAAIALVVTHFTAIKTVAGDSIRWVINHFLDLVSTIIHGSVSAFGWVPGLGGKLKAAAKAVDGFKNDVNKALSETDNSVTIGADTRPAYATIRAMMQAASNAVAYVQISAIAKGGQSLHGRQGFASGTKWAPRGSAWVGENGPELLNFRGGESVTPAKQSAAMAGHQAPIVHVTVQGSVVSERDLVRSIMSGIEQVQKRLGVPTVFGQQA